MRKAGFEEIRTIQYGILKETARYCDANNIRYFLTGGTLLGAVRHRGFIPWDDDIDIAVPRPDYERLRTLNGGKISEFYEISAFENNPAHARAFLRIVDNRTVYEHEYYQKKYRASLGIDVFPMDGTPEDGAECARYFKRMKRLIRQFTLSQSAPFKSTGLLRALEKTAASIPARIRGRERIYRELMRRVAEYPYETSRFVGITTGVYLEKEVLLKDELFPAADLSFENGVFHAPACYEKYLRQLYGDYMRLPKEEDRKPGHLFSVYWK